MKIRSEGAELYRADDGQTHKTNVIIVSSQVCEST